MECIEQTQIYLNFIVNMWKLSNAYTRHRILTHFGNHTGQGLTSVNFCLGKLSEAQSTRLACDGKKVVRDFENGHRVSLEANVSRFPFILFLFCSSWV